MGWLHDSTMEEIAREFRDCAAVFAGFVRQAHIAGNTITDAAYTGISLGWGWGYHVKDEDEPTWMASNRVLQNRLIRVMQEISDGGCIYTLGPQPGSVVAGNYCQDDPAALTGFYYFDSGSRGFTVMNNVADNGGAPCMYMQGWAPTIQPAWDIHAYNIWCRNTAPFNNSCSWQGCSADASTIYMKAADSTWPPEAQAIIDAAGAKEPLQLTRSLLGL